MRSRDAQSHSRPVTCAATPRGPAFGRWTYAVSADRRWALVCDDAGRNLAEIHRPAVVVGPEGRLLTFDALCRLMCAAPELLALLEESVAPGGIGPHEFSRLGGYRDRALAALASAGRMPGGHR